MATNLGSEDIVEFERVCGGNTMRFRREVEEFGEDSRVGRLGLYRAQDEERE